MREVLLALLWAGWCALHSAMISLSVQRALERVMGDAYRWYRLLYVTVSLATLVPLYLYSRSLRGAAVVTWVGPWRAAQALLLVTAALLFVAGARHYDFLQLVGIRQIREHETRRGITARGGLDTSGVLGVVRHPWYAGGMALLWSRSLDSYQLVVNTVLTAYLVIGAFLEERKLVAAFGDEYLRYGKRVSMLLPLKWLTSRLRRLR